MYLVINLGLKSIRGIIFDNNNEQIYSLSFPVHTTLFQEKVEQDPKEWIELLEKILEDIKHNTDLSDQIENLTVTTSSSCILGIDESGAPQTPVLMVSDKRASDISKEIASDEFYNKINDAYKITSASSSLAPKAIWFKRNYPEVYKKVRWWLGAGEYLSKYFTGKIFTDPLNAGKSFYSKNHYQIDLLKHFGIDSDTLPEVVDIGQFYEVDHEVIKKYNLSKNCKFVVSTYDAICAVLGSSTGEQNNACDVSGTVTSVRVLHHKLPANKSDILLTQPLEALDKYLVGASNNLGGGIIEWFKQAFYDEDDPEVYYKMENMAHKGRVGADGVLFLPYLLGERAPFINPDASASFFGIRRNSTIIQFTRAVFESTAFVTRDLVELIKSSGTEVNSLTVSGGLARFDLINQIKADVCNIPVHVVENFESTSIGALVIMKIANKEYSNLDEALGDVINVRKIINPSKKNHVIYNGIFDLFKKVNESLESIYSIHSDLKKKQEVHQNEIVRNL
ncbi:MAG: FGGY-family carbohydrate kinase [Balneolaceae bacterium]